MALVKLTQDKSRAVRWGAARALFAAFLHMPDKAQAWQDLHRLTQDKDSAVKLGATFLLMDDFSQVSDKAQAWGDLVRLTQDQNSAVRWVAALILINIFSQVPDKAQAWQDLHKLTQDKDSIVRLGAAGALSNAFSQVPDKAQAWQDLHRLAQDEECGVRRVAIDALGNVFSQAPDKAQAWQDLLRYTQDKDRDVRSSSYRSLGRASIFKATETKDCDTLRRELIFALTYFKKSYQESSYDNPAGFCLSFYRAYLAVTFQEAKEDEVQRYLVKAKKAIGSSESKIELLKAIENLARALHESQRLKDRPYEEIASELNVYRWYCEKAAEHMIAAEEKAPGAVKLMRRCNPLLEERIKATIAEIQRTAKQICRITKGSGTDFEASSAEINRAAKTLSLEDIHRTQKGITTIISQLTEFCSLLPLGKRELACDAIKDIELATEFPDKLDKIVLAIAYIGSAVETALQSGEVRSDIKQLMIKVGIIDNKLDKIRYAIFKQKINSENAITILTSIDTELEKLHQLSLQHPESSLKELYSCREEQLEELSRDLDNRFAEMKEVLRGKASIDDVKMVLDKLDQLPPKETLSSKVWDLADKGTILLTYISLLQEVIAVLR